MNKKIKQELYKEFLIRCVIYTTITFIFYLSLCFSENYLPHFETSWLTIFIRCYTTTKFVLFSLSIVIIISILLAVCHSFYEYWRSINKIDKFYIFSFQIIRLIFMFFLIIIGTIPIFFTATAFNLKFPNFFGALCTLVFSNLVILQVYQNIYNDLRSELSLTYLYGSMTGGITPQKTFLKRITLSTLDISKPAYLNLLGLSIFVEFQFNEAGAAFQGIAYELFFALYEKQNWNGAFQAFLGIVLMIFLIDFVWTYVKNLINRNN